MTVLQRVNGHAVPEWCPLQTLPRDGRTVEICDADGNVYLAKWHNGVLMIDSDIPIRPAAWRLPV